jgi:hypothetical protein
LPGRIATSPGQKIFGTAIFLRLLVIGGRRARKEGYVNVLVFNCGSSSVKFLVAEVKADGAAAKAEEMVVRYERKIADHHRFIREHGFDPAKITGWVWGSR